MSESVQFILPMLAIKFYHKEKIHLRGQSPLQLPNLNFQFGFLSSLDLYCFYLQYYFLFAARSTAQRKKKRTNQKWFCMATRIKNT